MRNGESNKIGLEEATKIANEVIGFLDGEIATKGSKSRRITDVVSLRGGNKAHIATKSSGENVEMPDTLAYLFNFADSAGYTIIAADTRIETPVLCYAGSGTLGDTIDNPGLAVFLIGSELYFERFIIEAQQQRNSLLAEILAKIDETGTKDTIYVDESETSTKAVAPIEKAYNSDEISTSYSYGTWSVYSRVGPLLPVEWSQRSPYNELVKNKNCSSGTTPTGCVATATAQIMTYWGYPNNLDSYTFDWSLLRQYTEQPNRYDGVGTRRVNTMGTEADRFRQQISRLMERIGGHISMDYSCGGSSAYTDDAAKYLRSIGYSGGSKEDFNTTSILNSLNSGRPVLSDGFSTKTNHSVIWGLITWTTYSDGHAWVMDGYLQRSRKVTVTVTRTTMAEQEMLKAAVDKKIMLVTTTTTSTYTEYSPYFIHNNWGWGGLDNGYYVAGSFDTNRGADLGSTTKSSDPYNFKYKNEIFPNIRR